MRLSACLLLALTTAACDDAGPSAGMDPTPDVTVQPVVDAAPGDAGPQADAAPMGTEETCNGVDDDLDGRMDEGFPGLGDACQAVDGMCTSTGRQVCAEDGQGIVCDAPPPAPVAELCDGKDNDCDGNMDEGIDLEVDPNNCARCGNVCAFDHANPACDEAVCIFTSCEAGFGDANGIIADGCECPVTNGGVEACDGEDNDCDGSVDEGLGLDAVCVAEENGCRVEGVVGCDDAGGVTCLHIPVVPMDEACDGRDNDCDGLVDEDFDADADGFAGAAACPAEFRLDCDDAEPALNPNARDVCEDGIDQNCDGADAPCGGTSAYVSRLAISGANGAGCRDYNGDQRPDNAFSGIAALANGQIQDAVESGQVSILPTSFGLAVGARRGRFDLAILLGQLVRAGTYRISPASYNGDGEPNVLFVNASLVDGVLTAGPGNFPFQIPIGGPALQLDVQEAMLSGLLSLDEGGLTIIGGFIAGIVPEESLQAALVILPPEVAMLVPLVLQPDVDRDGDGEADAYSACLEFDARPAVIAP